MNRFANLALLVLLILAGVPQVAAAALPTLTCVGLYSETSDGSVSYRVGKGDWTVVKVGDVVPSAAEVRINVEQDWVEFVPTTDPTKVYDLEGSDKGEVVLKVADVLKGKVRTVTLPKKGSAGDPAFVGKLVVGQVWGRQVYRANADTPDQDIHYGDVLDAKGKVRIIGINNTLTLIFPNGAVTTVVGPLSFPVQKVFDGTSLYKFLNTGKK